MVPGYIFSTVLVLLSLQQTTSTQVVVGAIIDGTSRAGMEANVSLQIALDDISRKADQKLVLHITNSYGKPAMAAPSGKLYYIPWNIRRLLDYREEQNYRSNIPTA